MPLVMPLVRALFLSLRIYGRSFHLMNSWPWRLSLAVHMLMALGLTYVVLPPDGVLMRAQLPLPTHQAGVTRHTWRRNGSAADHAVRRRHLKGLSCFAGRLFYPPVLACWCHPWQSICDDSKLLCFCSLDHSRTRQWLSQLRADDCR